jgi:hypothetical protein
LILTPIVLIAAVRSLYLRARGQWTRTDRVLVIAGATLYFGPWVLGALMGTVSR